MRRRPLLRAAAVTAVAGGAGYYAGKRNATTDMRMDELESNQMQQAAMAQPAPQPAMATAAPMPAAAPAPPMGPDEQVAALERLGHLRDSGVLTPEEFALQKARILSS